MMAITTKIHANNTKKAVITKLSLKVTDLQWIEFEIRSRTLDWLEIATKVARYSLKLKSVTLNCRLALITPGRIQRQWKRKMPYKMQWSNAGEGPILV